MSKRLSLMGGGGELDWLLIKHLPKVLVAFSINIFVFKGQINLYLNRVTFNFLMVA